MSPVDQAPRLVAAGGDRSRGLAACVRASSVSRQGWPVPGGRGGRSSRARDAPGRRVPERVGALDVRVCSWHRQIRRTRSRRPLSAWEPLIIHGGGELPTNVTQTATDARVYADRYGTSPGAMAGLKPPQSVWMSRSWERCPATSSSTCSPAQVPSATLGSDTPNSPPPATCRRDPRRRLRDTSRRTSTNVSPRSSWRAIPLPAGRPVPHALLNNHLQLWAHALSGLDIPESASKDRTSKKPGAVQRSPVWSASLRLTNQRRGSVW